MSSSSTFQRTSFVRRALLSMLGLLALTVLVMTALVIRHDHPLDIPSDQSRWDALALPDAQPPAGLSFTTFLTAQSAGAPEGLIVAGGSWFTPRRPVQFAVLIRHPKGNLLFDTGLGLRHAEHFAENTWWHQQLFAYTMHTPVKTQLTQQGMADLPLRWIVPSHMHWDHVSALPDFPALPLLAGAEEIGQVSTVFKFVGPNDRIVVEAFDDPKVEGVTCYLSRAKTGGVKGGLGLAEDRAEASIACRQVGPIRFKGELKDGDEVFKERTSLVFKTMQVVRFLDKKRNTLVYLVYSDRLIEGSPQNAVTAIPILPWAQ